MRGISAACIELVILPGFQATGAQRAKCVAGERTEGSWSPPSKPCPPVYHTHTLTGAGVSERI